jgi:uroporphyrinogen-III synthase
MAQRVIVTRPAHDADVWVASLQESGFAAQALPLIDIAGVSGPADIQALEQACARLDAYAACMFVSSHAAEHFFRHFSESKIAPSQSLHAQAAIKMKAKVMALPVRFLAPGPGTGAALLAAGVAASQIDMPPPDAAQFDSETLWQVVGQRQWRDKKVLIVRGKDDSSKDSAGSGREWLIEQWRAKGSTVEVVSSYERRAPQLNATQIDLAQSASQDGSVWLFSSSQAITYLTGQPGLKDVDWQKARAVATHPRIQAAAQAAGWGVVKLSRPALADIADTLASIESTPP